MRQVAGTAAAVVYWLLSARAVAAQRVDPAWLQVRPETKTAEFQLIAGLTGLNGALNFNGFRDGGLTLMVPRGWQVVMRFRNNDGMLPHSAEVIADTRPIPPGPVPSAFDRAFTTRLSQGLPPQGEDEMRFAASKAGSFLIFCAVPGHGTQGMWIRFKVSDKVHTPSVTATKAVGS
jgi:hypothetical protein